MSDSPGTGDAAAQLRRALGTTPPESVIDLPPPVLERLVGQIESGRLHHLRMGEDAVRSVVNSAPLAVRGLLRRALQ